MTAHRIDERKFTQVLRTSQIIGGSLSFGCLAFAAVAIVIRWGEPAEGMLISIVGVVAAVLSVIARQVMRTVFEGQVPTGRRLGPVALDPVATEEEAVRYAREKGFDESRMDEVREQVAERLNVNDSYYALYQTWTIIGFAILEGGIFLNLVAYIVEGQWWSLLAAGLLALWMVSTIPTAGSLRRWIDDRENLKAFGPHTPPT